MSPRAEIQTNRLPIVDLSLSEKTAEVLRKNIKFKWKGTQEWAGLTKADLVELTVQIAVFIGITPEQAKKITVIFGDHYKSRLDDSPYSAVCQSYHRDGVYSKVMVVLNRSLEVLQERITITKENREKEVVHLDSLGLYDSESDDLDRFCELTPPESVVWSITEELKHAQVDLMAGSPRRVDAWSKRYLEMLKKRGLKLKETYDTDLQEVVANRLVLRVLTHLGEEDAKEYFRDRYLRSLQSRRVYFASFTKRAFTQTGYKAPLKSKIKATIAAFLDRNQTYPGKV